MLRKALIAVVTIGLVAGAIAGYRLLPLVTTDNDGSDIVVLLHGLGRNEMAMLVLEAELTGGMGE